MTKSSDNAVSKELFIDLSKETRQGNQEGLLGMVFHPKFVENRRYFLKMHRPRDGKRVVMDVLERRAANDGKHDLGAAPRTILSQEMPDISHNGGHLAFGPDGFLYIAFGDGGPQYDPHGYSQSLESWLGKFLRIDVDRPSGALPYSIPADNPFLNDSKACPEIWALGFREPWRFSFDRKTGDLWVGDVGQHKFEEVSIVRRGENHGWNVYEGFAPFSEQYRRADAEYVPPLLSYSHRHGVSVTGGYVYRGKKAPAMQDWYIFSDYESRRIWALAQKDGAVTELVEITVSPSKIASFAEDEAGEIYAAGHFPSAIYHVDLSETDPAPVAVRALAAVSDRHPVFWRMTTEEPASGWASPEFDDTGWSGGPGGFGSGNVAGAFARTRWKTPRVWLRSKFEVKAADASLAPTARLRLRVFHTGNAKLYVNGVEAATVEGKTNAYRDYAVTPAAARTIRAGTNVLAVYAAQGLTENYIDAGLIICSPLPE